MTPTDEMESPPHFLEPKSYKAGFITRWFCFLLVFLACSQFSSALAQGEAPLEQHRQIIISTNLAEELVAKAPRVLQGTLRARQVVQSEHSTLIEQTLQIPGQGRLQLDCSTLWEISLDSPHHWTRTETIAPCEGEGNRTMHVFAAGSIAGSLKSPDDLPENTTIQFEFAPNPTTGMNHVPIPSTQQVCPISEGRWSCTVPAGKLDLRLAAGDFVPHYFWDVAIDHHHVTDLGTHQLEPGASLAGWVSWHDVPAEASVTEITLEPQRFGWHRDANERRHLASMKRQTFPTARGFFQFRGLPAGEYQLSARSPGASAQAADLTILETRETQLEEPIVLKGPIEVRVFLEPPLDPLGRPWLISAGQMNHTGIMTLLKEAEESTAGSWSTLDLEPGQYLLSIGDPSGSSWVERWLDVVPGMRPVFIEVPVVAIEGHLTLGEAPLQATLVFGSTQGQERVRITTDEDGRFEGHLPREGEWPVDLVFEDGPLINQALVPVDVRRRPGKRRVFLEIALPDTRLQGVVVADNKPVPRARMAIVRDGEAKSRDAILYTNDQGEFELVGLSPGVLHVYAYSKGRTSPWVEVNLRETSEAPSLRLTLQEKIRFSGLVLSPTGPIPGAEIALWPTIQDGSFALLKRATSGVDGSFEAEIPQGTTRTDMLVMAPGFAHRLLTRQIPSGEAPGLQIVEVESAQGTLIVNGIEFQKSPMTTAEVHYQGARFPLDLLIRSLLPKRKVLPTAGALRLLQMAPGEYHLCASTSTVCQSGLLLPEGELLLGGQESKQPQENPPQTPPELQDFRK